MSVLAVLIFVALAVLAVALRLPGGYPDRLDLGGVTVEFSAIDRACYVVAMISVITSVAVGVSMIWDPDAGDVLWRVLGTSLIALAGALGVLVLHRLMRGGRQNS